VRNGCWIKPNAMEVLPIRVNGFDCGREKSMNLFQMQTTKIILAALLGVVAASADGTTLAGAAELIPYAPEQVINEGDSAAVIAEKAADTAALLRQAPAPPAGNALKIGVSRDQKERVIRLIP